MTTEEYSKNNTIEHRPSTRGILIGIVCTSLLFIGMAIAIFVVPPVILPTVAILMVSLTTIIAGSTLLIGYLRRVKRAARSQKLLVEKNTEIKKLQKQISSILEHTEASESSSVVKELLNLSAPIYAEPTYRQVVVPSHRQAMASENEGVGYMNIGFANNQPVQQSATSQSSTHNRTPNTTQSATSARIPQTSSQDNQSSAYVKEQNTAHTRNRTPNTTQPAASARIPQTSSQDNQSSAYVKEQNTANTHNRTPNTTQSATSARISQTSSQDNQPVQQSTASQSPTHNRTPNTTQPVKQRRKAAPAPPINLAPNRRSGRGIATGTNKSS